MNIFPLKTFKFISDPINEVTILYQEFLKDCEEDSIDWFKISLNYFRCFREEEFSLILENVIKLDNDKSKHDYYLTIYKIIYELVKDLSELSESFRESERNMRRILEDINLSLPNDKKYDIDVDDDVVWYSQLTVVLVVFTEELEILLKNLEKYFNPSLQNNPKQIEKNRLNIPWWLLKPFMAFCIEFGFLKDEQGNKISKLQAPKFLKSHFILDDGMDNYQDSTIRRELSVTKFENVDDNTFLKVYNPLAEMIDPKKVIKP